MPAKKQAITINLVSSAITTKPLRLKSKWTCDAGPAKNGADDNCLDPANYMMGSTVYKPHAVLGYSTIEVLSFLKGRLLDKVVMGYVHSLRPSSVRITTSGTTLDCRLWRVTIYATVRGKKQYVRAIYQEVQVALPKGVVDGQAMSDACKYGVNSPEVKWHQGRTGIVYSGGFMYKMTPKGLVKRTIKPRGRPKALWLDEV